ncbi:hypothetical protein GLIP_2229 [Aliiglaciecola lipolytica E3]|uniref:Uncharacterized protein n=1 Tax=Aliiglaciecola lipolytica E3 TaxID=1127673 RepID=K6Y9K2_9ALTE|nr:hypothetical protein GLIP_2229 [Aliiglaciecola lipolytica E3]
MGETPHPKFFCLSYQTDVEINIAHQFVAKFNSYYSAIGTFLLYIA